MNNSIIRIILIGFSFWIASTAMSQDFNPFAKEELEFSEIKSRDEAAESIEKYHRRLLVREQEALESVYNALTDKEELKNVDFDMEEIVVKSLLNVITSFVDEAIDKVPILGSAYYAAETIYDDYQGIQRRIEENKKISSKNQIVDLFKTYRYKNLKAQENNEDSIEDYKRLVEEKYMESPNNPDVIGFMEDLKKDIERAMNRLPSPQELELMIYQEILKEMYWSRTDDVGGYIEIHADYTNNLALEHWDIADNKKPVIVDISLKAGVFSKVMEDEINKLLLSNETKFKSVLDLKNVYLKVYSKYKYKDFEEVETMFPVTIKKRKIVATWDWSKAIPGILEPRKNIPLLGKSKWSDKPELLDIPVSAKNKSIILQPYKYLHENKMDYRVFKTNTWFDRQAFPFNK